MEDWRRDAQEAVRREGWSLRGPNQLVKVVPAGTVISAAQGYFTLGRFLLNKTPEQIETALGLRIRCLEKGARVYRFARLPQSPEYAYELTAEFPGGLAFHPASSDPSYPPGSRAIHQWSLKPGVEIPVDVNNFLDLKPGQPFPYIWLI